MHLETEKPRRKFVPNDGKKVQCYTQGVFESGEHCRSAYTETDSAF